MPSKNVVMPLEGVFSGPLMLVHTLALPVFVHTLALPVLMMHVTGVGSLCGTQHAASLDQIDHAFIGV